MNHFKKVLLILLFSACFQTYAQEVIVDQIAAIVGKNIILESEIETQYWQQRLQQGITGSETTIKCQVLEDLLLQKLLLNQAQIDSIEVTDLQVEQSMDQRMRYFVSQFGSEEKLEEFYNKTILEIKDEMRELIKEQLMVQEVQRQITAEVKITPSEVRRFYKDLPEDSIPRINSEVEIAQIVKTPPVKIEDKMKIRKQLEQIREDIVNAKSSFFTMAVRYSDDPGSAKKGGELGLVGRGEFYPEFEAVVFNLEKGEISDVFESQAGFHIAELIERKGEYVNVRHILLRLEPSVEDEIETIEFLDSIAGLINNDSITFEQAAMKYSDDPGKSNGGILVNTITGNSIFPVDQLDPQIALVIDKLEIGDVSEPIPFENEDGEKAFRVITILSRTKPHMANLKDDYNTIQEWALARKQEEVINEWVLEKMEDAYINIIEEYRNCNFYYNWMKQ
jgi:peptidyl-prolyl cis-trans isomerase SurA